LSFAPVDERRYPCFALALAAARAGGTAPTVLSAANEVAVEAFLTGRLPYGAFPELIASALDALPARPVTLLDDVVEADRETRRWIREHYTTATRGDGR
jgi:1-deoxy-D-xylulose-5-phosphate reductoisomerase